MKPKRPRANRAAAGARRRVFDAEALARLAQRATQDEKSKCLNWFGPKHSYGYGTLRYKGAPYLAHRLSYMANKGPIPDGLYVCHRCDNPACISIDHLFLGTPQQNMDDARKKGRMWWRSILDKDSVAKIKRRLKNGETVSAIARSLSLRYPTVFAIKDNRTWRHVLPAPKNTPLHLLNSVPLHLLEGATRFATAKRVGGGPNQLQPKGPNETHPAPGTTFPERAYHVQRKGSRRDAKK